MSEPASVGERLAWPPTKEDLERLYSKDGLSAMKVAGRYGLSHDNPKSGETMILYYLKKHGIARRDAAGLSRKVTEEMVDEWVHQYQAGRSLKQIADGSVSAVTVFNHLHKRGLRLREKVDAQIKAVKKFDKFPFSGDASEKAYLLGFTRGDLAVSRHGRAVRVKTSVLTQE